MLEPINTQVISLISDMQLQHAQYLLFERTAENRGFLRYSIVINRQKAAGTLAGVGHRLKEKTFKIHSLRQGS